jgi:DNA-binding transcriptional ArsR family regulator
MKRDMELVRRLLIYIEERANQREPIQVELEGIDDDVVQYHLELLTEADIISTIDASSYDGKHFFVKRLTWYGHEFLDAARDDLSP